MNICHEFAARKNLKFGTNHNPANSKTKNASCLQVKTRTTRWKDTALGQEGYTLGVCFGYCDIALKRGKFIEKVNSLLQELHFSSPDVLMKLLTVYTTSFYGSPLWNIMSKDCDRLFKSWNVTVRHTLTWKGKLTET